VISGSSRLAVVYRLVGTLVMPFVVFAASANCIAVGDCDCKIAQCGAQGLSVCNAVYSYSYCTTASEHLHCAYC
jgi:hypothetical protein